MNRESDCRSRILPLCKFNSSCDTLSNLFGFTRSTPTPFFCLAYPDSTEGGCDIFAFSRRIVGTEKRSVRSPRIRQHYTPFVVNDTQIEPCHTSANWQESKEMATLVNIQEMLVTSTFLAKSLLVRERG